MITYEDQFNGKPILTDKNRKLGCETKTLEKIESLMDHVSQKHNKVLCVRMDVRYPKDHHPPKDNKHIQKFISKHVKYGKRNGYDPHYIWVREQSREKHQHYHFAMFYNGSKIQHPNKLLGKAEEHWSQTIGAKKEGLINYCKKSRNGETQKNHYRLRRNDDNYEQVKKDCFQRLSYFAKTNTKGKSPKRIREVSISRLPKNSDC